MRQGQATAPGTAQTGNTEYSGRPLEVRIPSRRDMFFTGQSYTRKRGKHVKPSVDRSPNEPFRDEYDRTQECVRVLYEL